MAPYGVPVWADDLGRDKKSCAKLASVWRRVVIRVVRGYRTLSHETATVLAGLPPLDLLARVEARSCRLLRHRREGPPPLGPEEVNEKKREIRRSLLDTWRTRLRRPGCVRHKAVGHYPSGPRRLDAEWGEADIPEATMPGKYWVVRK
ncbi:uncharacterized protein LOC143220989, partial [Lasioglossum baleicum]|uniref:uncharacterized protein LOC143220989 n=1 Tax=Lasioglossum baleicum TaxID=434251 RepID=UPI003FCE0772